MTSITHIELSRRARRKLHRARASAARRSAAYAALETAEWAAEGGCLAVRHARGISRRAEAAARRDLDERHDVLFGALLAHAWV
jgi:hypothetical protein